MTPKSIEHVKGLWLAFDSWWQLTRGTYAKTDDAECWNNWWAYATGHPSCVSI